MSLYHQLVALLKGQTSLASQFYFHILNFSYLIFFFSLSSSFFYYSIFA